MALALLVVLAPPHFENANFVVTTVGEHLCRNRCASYKRRADGDLLAVAHSQNLINGYFDSDVRRHLFYFDFIAGAYFVLLATGFYDRVHGKTPFALFPRFIPVCCVYEGTGECLKFRYLSQKVAMRDACAADGERRFPAGAMVGARCCLMLAWSGWPGTGVHHADYNQRFP